MQYRAYLNVVFKGVYLILCIVCEGCLCGGGGYHPGTSSTTTRATCRSGRSLAFFMSTILKIYRYGTTAWRWTFKLPAGSVHQIRISVNSPRRRTNGKLAVPKLCRFLKGADTRFSSSGFFHESVCPRPISIPSGPFWIFSKIRRDIRVLMFIAGVVYTGEKLFSGVNDTGDKFFAGVKCTKLSS